MLLIASARAPSARMIFTNGLIGTKNTTAQTIRITMVVLVIFMGFHVTLERRELPRILVVSGAAPTSFSS
jgi:hypothetical protein